MLPRVDGPRGFSPVRTAGVGHGFSPADFSRFAAQSAQTAADYANRAARIQEQINTRNRRRDELKKNLGKKSWWSTFCFVGRPLSLNVRWRSSGRRQLATTLLPNANSRPPKASGSSDCLRLGS